MNITLPEPKYINYKIAFVNSVVMILQTNLDDILPPISGGIGVMVVGSSNIVC